MNHFYENIQGWFSYPHFYKEAVEKYPTESHFVEVGSWKGKSTSFMAVEIINSGKNIKFDCVDTWQGSLDEEPHRNDPSIINGTLYDEFLKNTNSVKHIINPIRLTSIEASKLYDNNSLDFVLIDASHIYQDVYDDINSWLPKIKIGGTLAGDDYSEQWPGVMQATNELIPFGHLIVINNCWKYIVCQ
jgi:hypothetical protein